MENIFFNNIDLSSIICQPLLMMSSLTTVTEAMSEMSKTGSTYVLAIDKKQLIGIFTERDLIKLVAQKTPLNNLFLAEVMSKDIITIRRQRIKDIFQISQLLNYYKIRHLPVVDEEQKLIGVITPQSINRVMKPEYLLRNIKVSEAMVNNVVCGFAEDSILDLTIKMVAHRISCIVVVERKANTPVGIITERDITQFRTLNLNLEATSVKTVMSTPLETVQPEDSLWNVYQKMQDMRVRRLVVIGKSGNLAGIVTQTQMLKLLDPSEMYEVIKQMQSVIEEQTRQLQHLNQQLRFNNEKLKELAVVDELTKVMNRRRFNEYFKQQWQRLKVARKPLSLIICDVDHFKSYNDAYGHASGDRSLVQVARILQKSVRQTIDLVARYGGEEFAIILPDCDEQGAKRVAQNIIRHIRLLSIPHQYSSTASYLTVSMGVATAVPNDNGSPQELFQTTDELLYRAKQEGRNTYRYSRYY